MFSGFFTCRLQHVQVLNQQDATLSQGQPRDAPYITSVLTPILPLTLSLSITYNNRHVSHYYGQLSMIKWRFLVRRK